MNVADLQIKPLNSFKPQSFEMGNTLYRVAFVSAVSCFLACAGDFVITFILGALYPGYNFICQSESSLGTSDSPVALYMNVWGVVFCFLLVIFAWGLKKTIFSIGKWQTIVVWFIILYGIGEGAGSGLFPYNHVNNVLTLSGKLHSFFGVLGGVAITFIPFACLKIFSEDAFPRMYAYCRFAFFGGLIFVMLFLTSEHGIIPYKGLWQRIFILNYHLFLSVLAVVMLKGVRETIIIPGKAT